MNLGTWQLDSVSGGRFSIDGGAMFGIIPKPMWEKVIPADNKNRIPSATHCILARDGDHTVLIDTGYGGRGSEKDRRNWGLEEGEPLLVSLAVKNIAPDEIDTVILSHLHFDHAGGATRFDANGRVVPTFPKARYIVQTTEWFDATCEAPELFGAYRKDDFAPLAEAGCLEVVDDGELVPGIRAEITGGHTRGHWALFFESAGQTAVFPADLCPMRAHLQTHWIMSYDIDPLETRRAKSQFLGRAADEEWLILWDHDPHCVAARIARDKKREFVTTETFEML